MRKYVTLLAFVFSILSIQAQATFYQSGSIRYIRKTNGFRLTEGSWLNQFFQKTKFVTDTFQLDFNAKSSVYYAPSYDPDAADSREMYFSFRIAPSNSQTVYKNLETDTLWAARDLFDERILITDSFRNIKWKITGEVREIAGFTCRKAVGLLYDSLYVVAFYTDQITTPSGPETFGKLPGMILGLAIPRLYTTWMAMDFKAGNPEIKKPTMPKKKKNTYSFSSYYTGISDRFKNWGPLYATLMVWMWGM